MGYQKYRIRQKQADGTYDIFHVESRSSLILRYTSEGVENGTVESALSTLETDVAGLIASQSKNVVYAGPATDPSAAPTFRALVADDIPSITKSKISDFPETMPPSSHTHGNITNDGKISSDTAAASGDKLVLADSVDGTIQRSGIALGTGTTTYLRNDGTWGTPAGEYVHPTYTAADAAAKKIGRDTTGHVVIGDALTYTDVGAAASDHTHNYAGSDSAGGAANSTKAALTFGDKTFNGSTAQTITAADLGLSSALKFIGITTTALTDGATTNPITIDGKSVTATKGDVAIYNGMEFLWDGSKWVKFGDESSWALKDHVHGKISKDGTITSDTDIAAGDKIVVVDADDSKVQRSSIAIGSSTTTFLRNDGSWGTPEGTYVHPTDKTAHAEGFYKVANDTAGHVTAATAVTAADVKGLVGIDMSGATASAAGIHGLVPAPAAGDQAKVLSGAGTWVEQSSYTHPTQTAVAAAAKKVGCDALGHVVLGDALTYTDVGAAAPDHTHGNITSGGAITATGVAIASGDTLTIVDSSASGKLVKSSISFDGSTATKALTQKGTWETFNNYVHPSYTAAEAAAKKVGCDATGHVVLGADLTYSDVGAAAASHNHALTDCTGTLTVAKGGTGATTAAAARSNLGAVAISTASTQPTDQNTGDFWLQAIS